MFLSEAAFHFVGVACVQEGDSVLHGRPFQGTERNRRPKGRNRHARPPDRQTDRPQTGKLTNSHTRLTCQTDRPTGRQIGQQNSRPTARPPDWLACTHPGSQPITLALLSGCRTAAAVANVTRRARLGIYYILHVAALSRIRWMAVAVATARRTCCLRAGCGSVRPAGTSLVLGVCCVLCAVCCVLCAVCCVLCAVCCVLCC